MTINKLNELIVNILETNLRDSVENEKDMVHFTMCVSGMVTLARAIKKELTESGAE